MSARSLIHPARDWVMANALMIALVFAGLMLAAATVQTVRLDGLQLRLPLIGSIGPQGWKPRALAAEAKFRFEIEAHKQTKDTYRQAQADAARQQTIRLAMHRQEVEHINEKHRSELRDNLAALRSRYERLLAQAKAGAGFAGAAGTVRVPINPDAAGRTDAASGDGGFLAAREPLEQLERDWIATKQAQQLNALISWVEDQVKAGQKMQEPRNQ